MTRARPLLFVVFARRELGHVALRAVLHRRDEVRAVIGGGWSGTEDTCRRYGIPFLPPGAAPPPADFVLDAASDADDAPAGGRGTLLLRPGVGQVRAALAAGATELPVTVQHRLSGPAPLVTARADLRVGFEDTAFTLLHRVAGAAADLLHALLPALRAGDPSPLGAPPPPFPEPAGTIDWARSARAIYDLVRSATHPFEGARDAHGWIVWAASPVEFDGPGDDSAEPGTVITRDASAGVALVRCGAGMLRLERVQAPGGAVVPGSDYRV